MLVRPDGNPNMRFPIMIEIVIWILSGHGCGATRKISITSIRVGGGHANGANDMELGDPFVYKHLRSMATIGRYKALVDLSQSKDVFSISYCNGFLESIGKPTLPAFAQAGGGHANGANDMELGDQFVYKHLGSMATIARYKALVDLRQSKEAKELSMAGFVSWFIWRSAYLTRVLSWRNRFYVAINWLIQTWCLVVTFAESRFWN